MKKQANRVLWVGVMIMLLLLSGCGPSGSTPASIDVPEPTVTEIPTSTQEPILTPSPVETLAPTVPTDTADPERFRQYIGATHPPLSDGLSEGFSMLMQGAEGYALRMVMLGPDKMLWLDKISQYDSDGNPSWEVKDVLDLSRVEPGLILFPDGCALNGVADPQIISASRNGVVQLAWRANTTLEKFEVIPTDGIECHSDKTMDL